MHERLLHTAWADLAFTLTGLMTTHGDRLEIIDQGRLNGGSGPDFSMAFLRIGGIRICGSVEIHLRASDWYRHGHHKDPAYNNVILHTVLEDDLGRSIELEDGTHPPTFCIKPWLSPSFLRILEMGSSRAIPCAGQISYISDEVIEKQLASAGREYFEEKTRKLLGYYDEHLPLTDAWRKMLMHALFDILGVPANRIPMAELLKRLMAVAATGKSAGTGEAFRLSGLYGDTPGSMKKQAWDLKGCRPASSPHVRIPQALYLYNRILEFDIRSIPGRDPAESWHAICNYGSNPDGARPGAATLKTCFYTAFLPCAYILGNLIHSSRLQKSAYRYWEKARLPFAGQISKPLSEADERFSLHAGTPGSLYQFRNFCRQRRCDECRIFSALLSA
jgi:hypothetical protein